MAKILIIDDQECMRSIMTNMLESEGFEIQAAEDGEQALDLLSKADYDLIVSDVNLPRMDGFQFMRKARESHPSLPAIFATGVLEETAKLGAESLGNSEVIFKPYNKEAILEAIKRRLTPSNPTSLG